MFTHAHKRKKGDHHGGANLASERPTEKVHRYADHLGLYILAEPPAVHERWQGLKWLVFSIGSGRCIATYFYRTRCLMIRHTKKQVRCWRDALETVARLDKKRSQDRTAV